MSTKDDKFLQDYESIRKFMRLHFLFNDYTVDHAKKLGISPKRYNELKSTLAAYIKEKKDNTENKRINNRKTFSLKNSMFVNGYNYFCDIFGSKNIVSSQFERYIFILQLLYQNRGKPIESKGLCEDIPHRVGKQSNQPDPIDESTLNNHINELADLGYITIENKGGNKRNIRLSDDCLDMFTSAEEMTLFLDMLSLMRNIIQPYLCGNMLFETAQRSFESSGKIKDYKNPFTFKQSHFEQVLDDEIAWALICAVHGKNKISMKYKEHDRTVSPLEIATNAETGRRYLFAVDEKDHLISMRLDRISFVTINDEHYDASKYMEQLNAAKKYSFTGTVLLREGDTPQTIDLQFISDMKQTIEKLFPDIKIISEGEICEAVVLVNDPKEIKPWLRRNFGKVKIKDYTPLALEMEKDAEEWRKVYGIV